MQPKKEVDLEETARAALDQIERQQYAAALKAKRNGCHEEYAQEAG